MLTSLFQVVKWDDKDDEFIQNLKSNWLEVNFSLFSRLMHRRVRPAAAGPTVKAFEQLSNDSLVRVLLAPAFGYALRERNYDTIATLVFSELALHDRGDSPHLEGWSPLGDVWLREQPPPHVGKDILRKVTGAFHTPRLGCGVPIDFSISTALTVPSTGLRNPQHLLPGQVTRAVGVLNEAVDLLRQVNPNAFQVFLALTQNIVLRSSTTNRHQLRSGSSAAALGRIVLVNCDSPQIDVQEIAECLLHEAIHIAISCTELTQPLVSAEVAADPAATVVSPWSGARLHIHAFVHACLVWLALYQFWEFYHPMQSSTDWGRARLDYIRGGFQSSEFRKTVENVVHLLTEDAKYVMLATREAFS